jgi:hypothetical protein
MRERPLARLWIAGLGVIVIVTGAAVGGRIARPGHLPAALAAPLEVERTEACPAVHRWNVKTLTDGLAGQRGFR